MKEFLMSSHFVDNSPSGTPRLFGREAVHHTGGLREILTQSPDTHG